MTVAPFLLGSLCTLAAIGLFLILISAVRVFFEEKAKKDIAVESFMKILEKAEEEKDERTGE